MPSDVAKCSISTCEKSETCGYFNSTGLEHNFKYFCVDCDKYFLKYDEGVGFRETVKEEDVKPIEQVQA